MSIPCRGEGGRFIILGVVGARYPGHSYPANPAYATHVEEQPFAVVQRPPVP